MTLDEALSEAVTGARVRCDVMPEGCYVEHLFSHGFMRCWPVDRVEDEPNRTQCGFRPHGDELTADWYQVERTPVPLPGPAKAKDGWGRPITVAVGFDASTGHVTVDGKPYGEPIPEVKAVLTLKDGNWTKEPLTPPEAAPNKWGTQPPKGKWG